MGHTGGPDRWLVVESWHGAQLLCTPPIWCPYLPTSVSNSANCKNLRGVNAYILPPTQRGSADLWYCYEIWGGFGMHCDREKQLRKMQVDSDQFLIGRPTGVGFTSFAGTDQGEHLCGNDRSIIKLERGLLQKAYWICSCKIYVAQETRRHNMAYRWTTNDKTTDSETMCDWER